MGAGNLHELKRFPEDIFLFLKGEGFRPPLCGGETFDFEGFGFLRMDPRRCDQGLGTHGLGKICILNK